MVYNVHVALFRYVFPVGELPGMIWRQRFGDFSNITPCRILGVESILQLALLGGEHCSIAESPKFLDSRVRLHFTALGARCCNPDAFDAGSGAAKLLISFRWMHSPWHFTHPSKGKMMFCSAAGETGQSSFIIQLLYTRIPAHPWHRPRPACVSVATPRPGPRLHADCRQLRRRCTSTNFSASSNSFHWRVFQLRVSRRSTSNIRCRKSVSANRNTPSRNRDVALRHSCEFRFGPWYPLKGTGLFRNA